MPKPASDLLKALTLLAAALVCAALADGLARPERKLGWTGWAPPAQDRPAPAPVPPTAPAAPAAPVVPPAAPATPAARPEAPTPPHPGPALRTPARPQVPATTAAARFPPAPAEVIREISSQEALEAFGLKVPFLDARRSEDFLDGHIPGAWSLPVWEAGVEARITEFEARARPALADPVVLYCSGGDCEDSRLLAGKLVALGYRNLLIYRDGFPDWAAQGRPQQQGARP